MIFIILLLLLIGSILAILKPEIYILYFGILGSEVGAMGFTGFFNQYFQYYSILMQILLMVALVSSLIRYLKKIKDNSKINKWVNLSLLYIIVASFSILLCCLFYDFEGSVFMRIIKAIGINGPAIFIIWLTNFDKMKLHKKSIWIFSLIQCGIAFLIIYGPKFGFNFFSDFNAALYMNNNSGYYYLDSYNNNVALLSNFWQVFIGTKNSVFIKCAQFHNANGLGMAAGVLLFLSIEKLFYEKKYKSLFERLFLVIVSILSFLLWCNAGTRGVIIGIVCAFLWLNFQDLSNGTFSKRKIFGTIILLFIFLILIVSNGNLLISYFVGSEASGSFISRSKLMESFWKNLLNYVLIGNAGDLDTLVSLGIDPHFLAMRICCMYGIIPSILILIIVFIKPIKISLFSKGGFYRIGTFLIIFFIGITNNYAEPVLFWLLLAESIIDYYEKSDLIIQTSIQSKAKCYV